MRSGRDVYIVGAVRTPVGRRGGGLSAIHPADLGAHVMVEVLDRSGVPADAVGDVVFGAVNQIGAQAGNVARIAWLSAGLPHEVPGVTVDRRCGSAQQAVDFAAQMVAAGQHDVVVAGGLESMSVVPIGSPAALGGEHGYGVPYGSEGWAAHFDGVSPTQFAAAEAISTRWGISRTAMEDYAAESHRRAVHAIDAGWFDAEIAPIAGVVHDEGARRTIDREKMASLPPLVDGGRVTAAVTSQISDAAAALVLASADAVERHGLTARAQVVATTAVGANPVLMLTGPIPATSAVLRRAGMDLAAVDRFEVNEAFAPVVLAWAAETGAPLDRTNVNGGAISLGHPLGATGARLMVSLLHELERIGGGVGLQTMCEAGGTANATVLRTV